MQIPDGSNKAVFLQQSDGIQDPRGISSNNTSVAITSFRNHTLHLFDTDGKLKFKYGGKEGSGLDQFNHPWGVALDAAGRVLVADCHNNRVPVISCRGQTLDHTPVSGWPCGLSINNEVQFTVSASFGANTTPASIGANRIKTFEYCFE